MKKNSKWMVSVICLFIGFMVAIQFQTTTQPEVRDTRDEWEVREALQDEQKNQRELLEKIRAADKTLEDYEAQSSQEQLATLKESIDLLESRVGLTEAKGKGVVLNISPIFQEGFSSEQLYPSLTPQMLSRLINELNTYGAEDIAIANERLTNLSPVRDVNGMTYVNNRPLPSLPLTIQVLTDQPQKLKDYMEASQSRDMLSIENLDMEVETSETMTLPKYDAPLHLEILEETGE
ncbi:DUF881 domain-containing protein [Halobacillus locisalis]|uniref:DUF881 domain-containing protein n=1 Tax=Halobacillus locisalis TaxID=220753 RepID=A0A838CQM5_9BACI|nr:DUF881 domain-containing protein [Halobacillus locisalis]MBA2174261.1 DUF881 domain-containing protein [Halobacillus locisalis]